MKAESGKVSHLFNWIIVGIFGLVTAGVCIAQSLQLNDVCGAFQHQTVTFSTATPTVKLVSGVAGTTIYVCKIHMQSPIAYASPSLILYSGTGTTCGTTNTTIGQFGTGSAAGVAVEIGDGSHTIANTVLGQDLCKISVATTFEAGVIEYVQR